MNLALSHTGEPPIGPSRPTPAAAGAPVGAAQPVSAVVSKPRLPLGLRVVLSLLLAFHVAAIYVGPFSMGAMGVTSPLGETLRRWYRPYLEIVGQQYQGYQYFNEPGPSHRMKYRLEFADGRIQEGVFPSVAEHWPRLLYHRHFMLTETHFSLAVPGEPPPEIQRGSEEYNAWRRWRDTRGALGDACLDSYARHLLAAHGARRVTIWGLERRYPSMEEVRDGAKLGDARYSADPIKLIEREAIR